MKRGCRCGLTQAVIRSVYTRNRRRRHLLGRPQEAMGNSVSLRTSRLQCIPLIGRRWRPAPAASCRLEARWSIRQEIVGAWAAANPTWCAAEDTTPQNLDTVLFMLAIWLFCDLTAKTWADRLWTVLQAFSRLKFNVRPSAGGRISARMLNVFRPSVMPAAASAPITTIRDLVVLLTITGFIALPGFNSQSICAVLGVRYCATKPSKALLRWSAVLVFVGSRFGGRKIMHRTNICQSRSGTLNTFLKKQNQTAQQRYH